MRAIAIHPSSIAIETVAAYPSPLVATKARSAHRCPRCDGPLLSASDAISEFRSCLMCGYMRESEQIDAAVARAEAERTRTLPGR